MLDIGHSEDYFALQISFAPCLLGYGAIARRLKDDPNTKVDGNPYYKWIETYVADDYVEAVRKGREMLERYAVRQSRSRIEELVRIFVHATKVSAVDFGCDGSADGVVDGDWILADGAGWSVW